MLSDLPFSCLNTSIIGPDELSFEFSLPFRHRQTDRHTDTQTDSNKHSGSTDPKLSIGSVVMKWSSMKPWEEGRRAAESCPLVE